MPSSQALGLGVTRGGEASWGTEAVVSAQAGEHPSRHLLAQSPPVVNSPSSEIQNQAWCPLGPWLTSGAGEWLTFLQVLNPAFEGSCHGIGA